MDKIDVITCMAWVPKGKAKANPDKIELGEEELQNIIDETKDGVDTLQPNEDEYDQMELEATRKELNIKPTTSNSKPTAGSSTINPKPPVDEEMKDLDAEKSDDEFELNEYDHEGDVNALKLGHLMIHASSANDPYLDGDSDSDAEDEIINESDNVIIIGRLEEDASSVEAYVYNSEKGYYIHHDFLLPSPPLCMEWLNYDSRDENLAPGNMLAIGDMTPAINVWDLNCVGCIEPAFTLGFKKKRKKDKQNEVGHRRHVISLAWNAQMEHVLASGSVDETVILWDLEKASPAAKLTDFCEKVQCLKWNPKASHSLLTGCCDKYVRLFDCRSQEVVQKWKVKGEVESMTWDANDSNICMVATDRGFVYVIDSRQPTPKYHFEAHESPCSGLAIDAKCPGCLVTVGEDSTIKVWDVLDTQPELIHETKSKLGSIRSVCVSPDDPFVYSFGGDGRQTFRVWDIRNVLAVRQKFCPRLNMPVDDQNMDSANQSESEEEEEEEQQDDCEIVKRLKESLNKNTASETGGPHKKQKGGRLKK